MSRRISPHLTHAKKLFPSSHYALLSLFFFAGLQLIYAFHRHIVILTIILLTITALGIMLIRAEEGRLFHPSQIILPILAAIGSTLFALFLPTTFILQIYFLCCSIIFFFVLKYGAKHAWPTWNMTISLFVLFVNIASVLAWRFYLYTPLTYILPLTSLIVILLSVQFLRRFTSSMPEAWLLSLILGFVFGQISWALLFLPLHYIALTGLLVSFYYVALQLIIAAYEDHLTKKDMLEHVSIGIVAIIILLSTTRWV